MKIRYGKMISTALLGFLAGYIIARMIIGALVPESDFTSLDDLVKWIGTAEGGRSTTAPTESVFQFFPESSCLFFQNF